MNTPEPPPSDPQPETYLHIAQSDLLKLFENTKSDDFTRTQFEQEKTKRIVALSQAFVAVATDQTASSTYGTQAPRQQILTHLNNAMAAEWTAPHPNGPMVRF